MKKLMLICFGLALISSSGFAQDDIDNLVPNGDFEDVEGKLKKPGQIEVAVGWNKATAVKADLYAKKSKNEMIGIPDNMYGRQKVDEGSYYAGILIYAYQNKQPRSYITTQLTTPMAAGAQYCVQYDVCLADLSKYAVNNMGCHFSKKKVEIDNENHLGFTPVLLNYKNSQINDMDIWTTVCNVYEASGGEKHMTIGNFLSNDLTEYKKQKRPKGFSSAQKAVGYYYIDNVRVYMIDGADECACEKKGTQRTSIIYSSQVISEEDLTAEQIVNVCKIYFDDLRAEVQSAGERDLEILARTLQANPEFNLTVKAHIDKREAEKAATTTIYNDLAQKRADAVIAFLRTKGIASARLTVEIVNDKEPVDQTGTELAKAKNRRVEFVLK